MALEDWITRLEGQVAELRQVGGAADLAVAAVQLRAMPAAFVAPLAERADPNEMVNALSQRVEQTIAVVLAVTNKADATGRAAAGELETLRASVRTALLNWLPPGAERPVEYVGGRLSAFDEQVLFWQDEYLTDFHLRAT